MAVMSRTKSDVKKLFEYWCEVSRTKDTDDSSGIVIPTGVVTQGFPESFRDEKTIQSIPIFAFPCEVKYKGVHSFSFVLTTDTSEFRFGFCRYDTRTNTAMVILTYLPWHDTFSQLLRTLSELRRSENSKELQTFLNEAYNRGIPDPGGQLKLFYNNGQSFFVIKRPAQFQLPSIPHNLNLDLYFNFIQPKEMIAVFAAMLAERRIIFTSAHLDRLSSCIQAASAFLYPMVWQHIFIPILPMKFKEYLWAPMPYLIGVPETVLETVTSEELDKVVILNCDTKIFESPFDDVHDMPAEIVSQLKKQLSHTSSELSGDRVSRIFLGALVQLIGGYRDAVEFREKGKTFNRDKFIESRPSNLRPFLAKMMDLQIFQQFIDERLDMLNAGLGFSDEFEQETVLYAEKMKKRGRNLAFLKNVKDKTNPAVKSAYKSVKESSRGVKTAYKDLKSKFRDLTPPSSATQNFRSHLTSNSQHDRIDGYSKHRTDRHHSAPSSPVFSKRVDGINTTLDVINKKTHHNTDHAGFQYASPDLISGVSMRHGQPLATSNSSSYIQSNGFLHNNHHNNHLAASTSISPTISPASSLCSSEMNLSQELQNHPLFKTPTIDRSSLRSLQAHHMHASTISSQQSANASLQCEDSTNDLISLDDSNNTSFDLEDFDPLNQNARPLPIANGHINQTQKKAAVTLPSGMKASSISNPIYSYVTPKHTIHTQMPSIQVRPPPLPKTAPPPMPPPDEDYELLRKYGLDQFTLNATNSSAKTTTSTNATTLMSGGMSNWTTFE